MRQGTAIINRDFKTRDNKSVSIRRRTRNPSRLHWIILAVVAFSSTIFFSFPSKDAQAYRTLQDRSESDVSESNLASVSLPSLVDKELSDYAYLGIEKNSSEAALDVIKVSIPDEPQKDAYLQQPIEYPDNLDAALQPKNLWHDVVIKSGDTLAELFAEQGFSATTLNQVVALGTAVNPLKKIHPGQILQFHQSNDGQLMELMYHQDALNKVLVRWDDDQFKAKLIELTPEVRVGNASGIIRDSLFVSAQRAGLSDRFILELATIFAYDIDFALDIQEGDQFTLLYEENYLNGKKIGEGKILAASFSNQGKTYYAVQFEDDDGHSEYFTPDGMSLKKAFLRTPVDFSRISSGFSLGRKHPILNRIRAHKGVDYAAPTGTSIKAAGDGKIAFRGVKGGYGNVIVIQHGETYSTLYGHMSRFKKGLSVGDRVRQGETIGYVGSSGLATGPHLHYEFLVNGSHRNPLTVKLPEAMPLERKYRSSYKAMAGDLVKQLDLISNSALASTSTSNNQISQ